MRKPFSPDPELVSRAWDWVTSGIIGANDILLQAKPRFVAIMADGDVFRAFNRDLAAQLAGVEWEWPWLEEWRAKFRLAGLVPYLWRREEDGVFWPGTWSDLTFPPQGLSTVSLIAHTASASTYSLRRVIEGLEVRGGREKRLRLATPIDDAEAWASGTFAPQRWVDPNGDLPPFFPGDRSSVQWVTEYSAKRYGFEW